MKSSDLRVYRFLTSLELLSTGWLTTIVIGVILILGTIDYFTGIELSISFFYLIPIAIMAWVFGKYTGLAYSVFCAMVWLVSNRLSGQQFSSIFIEIWNTLIRFGFYGVVTILLAELRHTLEEEHLLANTDPLTGALNRRSFNEITEKRMIVSEVNRRPYTMVYIDLDDFKQVNDSAGHAEGDLVLKTVADTIQTQIRNTDLLARLGGDEFAILLADLDQAHAEAIVERLQLSLLEKMRSNNWEITFSLGVLTVLSMPESADTLVSLTDALMYEVKSSGKNAIKFSIFE